VSGEAEAAVAALMARALELARRGLGRTSPNPMVGAVIVRDGEVVGEGFHPRAGEPHAEIFALRAAGERARGADLYVTLEPCCHVGRTGPCTEAILAAGVARVFVGARDPNPRVDGGGVRRLREGGVEVVTGVLVEEATRLNEAFNHWITTSSPFVTLKLATSLDGRIATAGGASQWITGPAARARVHRLRAAADAILVGSGTALADDPRLTVRPSADEPSADERPVAGAAEGAPAPRAPLRIVVDSRLRVGPAARMFDPAAPGGALVATARPLDDPEVAPLRALGVEVVSLPDARGGVELAALFSWLGRRDPEPITSVLVEGGGRLAASLLRARLVHRFVLHQAPCVLGGDGIPAFAALGLGAPAEAPRLRIAELHRLGEDLELIAYPTAAVEPPRPTR